MRVEESVEINRPVEEVFSYAADPEHFPEWSGIILEVHREKPGPLTEGERFTTVSRFLGRRFETPFEITVHESPRRHSHKSTGGPLPQEWTLTCEEVTGGTRVTEVARSRATSAGRFWGSPAAHRFLSFIPCNSTEASGKTAKTPPKRVSTFSVRLLGSLR